MPVPRPAVLQPHVHWTLVPDWLWIIGLYTNVPEAGELDEAQMAWLVGELRSAPAGAVVILALHRPVYSVDVVHGSNLDLGDALDACFAAAGRLPDAVLSGHAHDYQRCDRRVGTRIIPYVVAGNGGSHELHAFGAGLGPLPARFAEPADIGLQAADCDGYGFLTVTVRPGVGEAIYHRITDRVADGFRFGPVV